MNDLFEVMRVALLTERVRRNDDDPWPPAAAGRHPRRRYARWCARTGSGQVLGSLEAGKKADLLVVDTQRAHLVPAMRIVSAWIHNGQPSDIESVMVDGQFIMPNRKILTLGEDRMVAEGHKVGRRIWGQVLAAGAVPVPRLSRQR